jgi:hypothetical protein
MSPQPALRGGVEYGEEGAELDEQAPPIMSFTTPDERTQIWELAGEFGS